MSEPTLTTQGKILKALAYILLGVGLIFFMIALSSIFMGIPPLFLDLFSLFSIGLSFVLIGAFLLAAAQQGILKPEFTTISLIKCANTPECKYRRAQKFENGDYIFKELEESCEKCYGKLYIAAILEVAKKARQKKLLEVKSEETLKQLEPTVEPAEKPKAKKEKKKEEINP